MKKVKISDNAYLLKNENRDNLTINREYNKDVIRGNFFITGKKDNEITSLNNNLMKYYSKKFDLQNYINTIDLVKKGVI